MGSDLSPRFRPLSGAGAAALSLWELQGTAAAMEAFLGRELPPMDRPTLAVLKQGDGEVLDQVLLWRRPAPEGGERLEVHLHGGYGVAQAFRQRLAALAWKESKAGWEDEDENRFLQAKTAWTARLSSRLRGGAFERELESRRQDPAALAAWIRASLAWESWAELLEAPPRIVLAGPANAGKSTLFNTWLQQRRVTVSPHPGTTRDGIEASVVIGPPGFRFPARLVDTAGFWRQAAGSDRQAVAQNQLWLQGAWQVLWVFDAAREPDWNEAASWLRSGPPGPRLLHRADLPEAWSPEDRFGGIWLRGSALQEGLALIDRLETALLQPLGPPPPGDAWIPFGQERRLRLRRLLSETGAK
ncbi:MAG: hypothetical protein DWQ01_14060 [Planctomycetota bacterium]|nr:MAG: hypothetical protein DWQ01_14060 [Planctomycetota bacterium]